MKKIFRRKRAWKRTRNKEQTCEAAKMSIFSEVCSFFKYAKRKKKKVKFAQKRLRKFIKALTLV